MPKYTYQAVDATGQTVKGQAEGVSASEVQKNLLNESLIVFEIKEIKSRYQTSNMRINDLALMLWVRQIATLLGAGYTLEKALASSAKRSQHEKLRHLSAVIHKKLVEGIPFYRILLTYPKLFNETFCATVRAGESSGHLDAVLNRLADYAENKEMLKRSVRQALIYPAILLIVTLLMIVYLMSAVVPDVVKVFSSSGQALPALTQWLLNCSHFLGRYGVLLLGFIILLVVSLKQLLKRPKVRYQKDACLLQMPIIGSSLIHYHSANYANTLAILLNAGITLLDALRISAETLPNQLMREVAEQASTEVRAGKSLAKSLQTKKNIFPPMLIELIDSGERTGQLATLLSKAATIYEQQSQQRFQTLTALLGPLIILLMGGLIFMIVLAILIPIFDLNQAVH